MVVKVVGDLIVLVGSSGLDVHIATDTGDVNKIVLRTLAKSSKYNTRDETVDTIHSVEYADCLETALKRMLTIEEIMILKAIK